MTDPIETTETLTKEISLNLNSPLGIGVVALAAYGAKALTFDVRNGISRFRENRKARKAAEKAETTSEQ